MTTTPTFNSKVPKDGIPFPTLEAFYRGLGTKRFAIVEVESTSRTEKLEFESADSVKLSIVGIEMPADDVVQDALADQYRDLYQSRTAQGTFEDTVDDDAPVGEVDPLAPPRPGGFREGHEESCTSEFIEGGDGYEWTACACTIIVDAEPADEADAALMADAEPDRTRHLYTVRGGEPIPEGWVESGELTESGQILVESEAVGDGDVPESLTRYDGDTFGVEPAVGVPAVDFVEPATADA